MPSALLISTYELGHQPFGLASPAAWLRADGIETRLLDLAKDPLDESAVRSARLIAFHLPMHTATRLAAPVIKKARAANPGARICAYGLYASLNAGWLRSIGVDDVLGGEFEAELAAIARQACGAEMAGPRTDLAGLKTRATDSAGLKPHPPSGNLPRLRFLVPDRAGLPPLERYSTLRLADGTRRVVGYTEASRGCRHLCRHCPVVPVYNGQFRVVSSDVVLADIAAQVASGAEHITFGDPDFFNGPTHALRIVEALHVAHPALTYDVTVKVEHLLQHRDLLPTLRHTGCLFVTSAVESIDDRVLALLDKGHTRRDFLDVVSLCRDAGVTLQPTFVAFHPWTTIESYCELLDIIEGLDLVDHVAPIQLAIRLLVPEGSRLLDVEALRVLVDAFDPTTLTYRWVHVDPRVDVLQRDVAAIVGRRLVSDRRVVFDEISAVAHERAGLPRVAPRASSERAFVPYRDEPWYCCAEPNPEQLTLV
ncbi:MAG: radical SAM protein [Acidobacteria bacterium RIFCSPLOWO2_02_FULL_65_29]|nr:MAG: radical SAM protein [Acidobacteria bacterium RIFCSPLOWO2_02_FULL_65_29]